MDEAIPKGHTPDDDGLKRSVSLAELRSELYRLRLAAGQPSFRSMAQKTGWSRATVGRVFSGESVPKWDVLEAVVAHLGGNTEMFRQLWIECMGGGGQPTAAAAAADESLRRGLASYVAAACFVLLFIVVSVQGLAPASASRNQAITDAAQLGFGLVAAGLWGVVFAKSKEGRALALALGLVGWSGGQAYWLAMRDIFDNPIPAAPSIGDLFYLLLPACVIPSFVAALPARLRWACAGVLVVLMLSTTAAAALALLFFIRGPVGAAVVYALYIVTDLTMLVVFGLFGWIGRRERNWSLAVAFCGVAVLLISDLLFVYFAWWKPQNSIPYGADVGYMIFPSAMSIAASYLLEKR
ncbi:helix-turn-helix domain-containing protein [Mycobacterium sp. SM1]|uniref:helix-turn-helix domain-containing protein n=1 Tax=Mycobacterium sp. SM1 TaxID=2816243 RepID=UPI001BCFB4FA|nr:helix-turn-helix domain-containing protein [Mycobacterium sp. SM1]MBS4730561.1 helix-turn-helix domain-containing protein [Mycobacterium sp. SM1]